ncbi:hypothetical protein [Paraburkholderia bannensis]|uniref:hypothetical protein n=1 Tax=Paraburkholderia bannensis TaxID=765414 RepID=UPI002AB67432|nr:hypothetical protein [Paraburkholderia bannensis]
MSIAPTEPEIPTLQVEKGLLIYELRSAHQIIRNALAVMTTEQQIAWGEMNARNGVDGEGATRAAERDALLTRARMVVGSA